MKEFSIELEKETWVTDRSGNYDFKQEVVIDITFDDIKEFFVVFFKENPTLNKKEFFIDFINSLNIQPIKEQIKDIEKDKSKEMI